MHRCYEALASGSKHVKHGSLWRLPLLDIRGTAASCCSVAPPPPPPDFKSVAFLNRVESKT